MKRDVTGSTGEDMCGGTMNVMMSRGVVDDAGCVQSGLWAVKESMCVWGGVG